MKLPACVYLPKNCCGAWEAQQTFNYLWKLADKNIDLKNIKASTFNSKSFVIKNSQVVWKYGPGSSHYPRFHEKGSGFNLIVRDGNSFCLVNKDNVDGTSYPQTLSFIPGIADIEILGKLGQIQLQSKADFIYSTYSEVPTERFRVDTSEEAFDLTGAALKHRRMTSEEVAIFSLPSQAVVFSYDRPTLTFRA